MTTRMRGAVRLAPAAVLTALAAVIALLLGFGIVETVAVAAATLGVCRYVLR